MARNTRAGQKQKGTNGADRAIYGERLLDQLSSALRKSHVSSTGRHQLYGCLAFYRAYLQIVRSLPAQFRHLLPAPARTERKMRTVSAQLKVPVGTLLCTRKDQALVEYALAGMDNKPFVSKYQLELPRKEEIQRFLEAKMQEVGDTR